MFLVTKSTVANRGALHIRQVPRKFMGRTALWPRGGKLSLWARLVFEVEFLRYMAALMPFVVATLIWREYALAIAQAPIPMLILIYLVEARLLRLPPGQRGGLVSEAEAERGLDLLRSRARTILTKIAAGRGIEAGRLHLVIEQSEMLRIAPLSLVSVQSEDGPEILDLTRDERALVEETLFQPPLTEDALQKISLARKIAVHDVGLDAREVSAHARLAAMMTARSGAD
ncbi:MAG: hypothetical protein GVY34_13475 [Alphaproteobacteria bacterium]|jgi:hypothetical protein|nr:hypothetical protein [Alphaproteobacteria bacterium]